MHSTVENNPERLDSDLILTHLEDCLWCRSVQFSSSSVIPWFLHYSLSFSSSVFEFSAFTYVQNMSHFYLLLLLLIKITLLLLPFLYHGSLASTDPMWRFRIINLSSSLVEDFAFCFNPFWNPHFSSLLRFIKIQWLSAFYHRSNFHPWYRI